MSKTKLGAFLTALFSVIYAIVGALAQAGVLAQETAAAIVQLLQALIGVSAALGLVGLRNAVGRVEESVNKQE